MDSLGGKIALVTGAAQGVGRAVAESLARGGATLVVCDVQEEAGEATCAAIRETGGEALFVRADATSQLDVANLVQGIVREHGRLDCAVNNAGTEGEVAATDEYSLETWNRVIGLNLTGVFLCMREELKAMRTQQSGAIVNIASICGVVGLENFSAYNAAKHGVIGLTKTAALEFATEGVRVNAVGPGFIRTAMVTDRGIEAKPGSDEYRAIEAMHPVDRLGEPREIGDAAAWLCSEAASFVTGHTLIADGGYVAR